MMKNVAVEFVQNRALALAFSALAATAAASTSISSAATVVGRNNVRW